MPNFNDIRYGWIVGITMHNGAVDSRFVSIDDSSMHGDFWEFDVYCRWRWRANGGLDVSIFDFGVELDEEQRWHIESHLSRVYGIPFDDNGKFKRKEFFEIANGQEEDEWDREDSEKEERQ